MSLKGMLQEIELMFFAIYFKMRYEVKIVAQCRVIPIQKSVLLNGLSLGKRTIVQRFVFKLHTCKHQMEMPETVLLLRC